jgi:hypothetical protein
MPAIDNGAAVVANANRLIRAATLFEVLVLITKRAGSAVPRRNWSGPHALLRSKGNRDRSHGAQRCGSRHGRHGREWLGSAEDPRLRAALDLVK